MAPEPASTAAPRRTLLDRLMAAMLVRRFFHLPLVQRVLLPARGERMVHKFIRYSMVSGVAIVISQLAILICTALFHTSGILANTVGAVVATPASYELNRKWAWGKHGKSHLWKEVAPFWALTLVGYLASTGTVELADNMCKTHHVVGLSRSLAIMAASLFAYGVVWIVKFLVFHHLVFGNTDGSIVPAASVEVRTEHGVTGPGGPAPAIVPAVSAATAVATPAMSAAAGATTAPTMSAAAGATTVPTVSAVTAAATATTPIARGAG